MRIIFVCLGILLALLAGCSDSSGGLPNSPYPAHDALANTYYTSFSERPKHLDPAVAYSSNEMTIIAQIYAPPLQYHYLKRPYELIPLSAAAVPQAHYFGQSGKPLPDNAPADEIAYSVYDIAIRPGQYYAPHPALAHDAQGHLLYQHLQPEDLAGIHTLYDFPHSGTREVVAADYVYGIKRLASPRNTSPVLGILGDYIVGMKAYAAQLRSHPGGGTPDELEKTDIAGVKVLDRYHYQIRVKGKYPQLLYWLAMPFFAPVPPEADQFYAQPGMAERNITLDWQPLGSGPYYLTENNPNLRMVLTRNPYYRGETYPTEGEPGDRDKGLLADAGKPIPFIDKIVFSLEKENIPYWNKFLEGYYDGSGISSDSFDQAIKVGSQGDVQVSDEMRRQDIHLVTAVGAATYYMGFNMRDPVVGGLSERARKLRQAISIAVDYEEYVSIFANGRGIPAQGPLPPGIFGYRDGRSGMNPVVYDWVNGTPKRKSINEARRLLAEAGYPDGRDAKTGKPLLLNLDTTARGPDDKARLDWLRKQFAKLNLQLQIRNTDYNRFQDKIRNGTQQLFYWGWNADYPDPENFLFLLYGPNARGGTEGGVNSANYDNPEYNRLFKQMENMANGPQRQALIDRLVGIAREDAPWLWGMHPKDYALFHGWVHNVKPSQMANNTIKYLRIDSALRAKERQRWNRPVYWPLVLLGALALLVLWPAWSQWRKHELSTALEDNAS